MAYRVDISLSALADAEAAYFWVKERAPHRAGDWYEGLLETIFSLETFPERCPIAPESEGVGKDIRQLFYGKRAGMYRILFGLAHDPATGEDVVRIYRIRHASRQDVTVEEIAEGESNEY